MRRLAQTLSVLAVALAFDAPVAPCAHAQRKGWLEKAMPWRAPGGRTWHLRAGYLPESPAVAFRGNVVYLEGLGDSMRNHAPLFSRLTAAGYRVIAFDYFGQGGSSGSMNDTRLREIPAMEAAVRAKFAREGGSPKRIVIGWSTGGLAAYGLAARGGVDAVVLLAPALTPRIWAGDKLRFTLATLTSQPHQGAADPHVDPIRPDSPLRVPAFATDLVLTGYQSVLWKVPRKVAGLVAIGGDDRYVHSRACVAAIRKNAPHFQLLWFARGKHEIHAEVPAITTPLYDAILTFLARL